MADLLPIRGGSIAIFLPGPASPVQEEQAEASVFGYDSPLQNGWQGIDPCLQSIASNLPELPRGLPCIAPPTDLTHR